VRRAPQSEQKEEEEDEEELELLEAGMLSRRRCLTAAWV
jgi:hypothetical protein